MLIIKKKKCCRFTFKQNVLPYPEWKFKNGHARFNPHCFKNSFLNSTHSSPITA